VERAVVNRLVVQLKMEVRERDDEMTMTKIKMLIW
jgi:hypothetical protein